MSKIKLFVMDVDGTLTDGRIYIGAQGEVMKAFDVRDGYAIANTLPALGIEPVIITGRKSEIVQQRAKELAITRIYQGVSNKIEQLKKIADEKQVKKEEIAYIGDDLNDLECILYCGITACPHDAVSDVLKQVDYICTRSGGHGAVREFIDYLTGRCTMRFAKADSVGLSKMCYTQGKANKTCLGERQFKGRIGKLL